MIDQRLNDKSFTEKSSFLESLFGRGDSYSQHEVREIWFQGIEHGIGIGLQKASVEGQRIELTANTNNQKHKEFLEKFYKLANEYSCAIQYHPNHGMMIIEQKTTHK